MARRSLLGTRDHEHPLRHVGERGPDLLAVDDPLAVFEPRRRGHAREVRSGARLGITLRPQLGDIDDAGQETPLLLVGPVGDERGAQQFLAQMIHARRCVCTCVLAMEDDALFERRTTTAVLDRPADAGPPGAREVTIPFEALGEELVFAARPPTTLQIGEVASEVLVEPRTHRGRELGGGVRCRFRPFTQVDGTIGEIRRGHGR